MFFVLLRAWYKEKIQIPNEESNLSPSESTLRNSQQLSHRDSKVSKARYEVHI